MATENQIIPFAAAKEYIQANYPNDPLLRAVAASLLDALPKVDAVEVVHGEWVDSQLVPGAYRCNKCGKSAVQKHNFCNRCGAKMDGGASDVD